MALGIAAKRTGNRLIVVDKGDQQEHRIGIPYSWPITYSLDLKANSVGVFQQPTTSIQYGVRVQFPFDGQGMLLPSLLVEDSQRSQYIFPSQFLSEDIFLTTESWHTRHYKQVSTVLELGKITGQEDKNQRIRIHLFDYSPGRIIATGPFVLWGKISPPRFETNSRYALTPTKPKSILAQAQFTHLATLIARQLSRQPTSQG